MSAYILQPERIAQLADYLTSLYNMGYNYFGYELPEEIREEIRDCRDKYNYISVKRVFEKLYNFNAAAVAGRYKSEISEVPEMPETKAIYHPRECLKSDEIREYCENIKPWHYELLKLIQCFIYQCSEEATINSTLYKGFRELERRLMGFIIDNTPAYKKAAWD